MAEHGMTDRPKLGQQPPTTQMQPLGAATIAWVSAHRGLFAVAGIAAVALLALALGAPLGAIALVGIVLLCPLMMIGMHGHQGHGTDGQPGSNATGEPSHHALDILRERYARGELTREQVVQLRHDLAERPA